MRKRVVVVLLLILVTGAFLRLYRLGTVPGGFFRDEAWNGYKAYSLLKTGKDTRGNAFPLFFAQWGDISFSSPFVYASIPFIYLFGLNETATRLPAALFGLLTVGMLYLCVKEFFGRDRALAASFLLAVSPWHIQFSRLAFRAITFPFFFLLAVCLLKKGLRRKGWLPVGFAVLGATIYTYSSAMVFIPLFCAVYLLVYRRTLFCRQTAVVTVLSLLLFLIIVYPATLHSRTWEGQQYFRGTTYVGDKLRVGDLKDFFLRYIGYFSPAYLAGSGPEEIPWPSPWKFGLVYFFEYPLILLGLYVFMSRRTRDRWLFIGWLFLYPFSVSLTDAYFHSLRTFIAAPLWPVLGAEGLCRVVEFVRRRRRWWLVAGYSFAAAALLNIALFVHAFFTGYSAKSSAALQYGYREAIGYIESIRKPEDVVKVHSDLVLSYIFVIFYTEFDPDYFHKASFRLSTRRSGCYSAYGNIGPYYFSTDDLDWENPTGKIYYLSRPSRRKDGWRKLKTITDPSGAAQLQIWELRK
ncbi:MAG: glycosyltransferase family 39 protein [PVC group bacterium]